MVDSKSISVDKTNLCCSSKSSEILKTWTKLQRVRHSFCLISIILFFLACNRVEVVTNLNVVNSVDSKIALFCMLTPSDSIYATVSLSRPIGDQKLKNSTFSDAIITLSNLNTGKKVLLTYLGQNSKYGCSQKIFPIVPNNKYAISASLKGLNEVNSSCTVPAKAAVIDKVFYGDPFSDTFSSRRRIELQWQDISENEQKYNYFLGNGFDLVQNGKLTRLINTSSLDNISKVGTTFFLNEETIDSNTPHTYYLFTTETNLFQYFKIYQKTQDILRSSTSDFFGSYQGIIPEFTNIEGGYGIFGAYLKSEKVINFK